MKNGEYKEEGNTYWFKNGDLHREDGPAVVWKNGTKEWYLNGQQLTELQFNQWIDMRELTKQLHFNFPEKSKQKKRI